ncbi:hypothetical protein AC1031_011190 [Aphanomyces cochlioides]|nr:hypothetical protein AC1031_011190 [Aphanomyces cochlioides]
MDRTPLEAKAEERKLSRPFGEDLLHHPPSSPGDSTVLYEGLITNLFAVHRGILYTADNDVFLGSTRQLVIDACRRLGVQFRLEPEDATTWDGAFVTSVVTLIVPIHAHYTDDGTCTPIASTLWPLLDQLREEICLGGGLNDEMKEGTQHTHCEYNLTSTKRYALLVGGCNAILISRSLKLTLQIGFSLQHGIRALIAV